MTEQTEREALLPCPWCNSPGMLREIGKGPQAFRVECSDGCCAMEIWHEDDPDCANRAWNARTPSPTYADGWSAGVEAAAKVCEELAVKFEAKADSYVVAHHRGGILEWSARWNAALNAATAIRALALPAAATDGDAVERKP